MTPSSVDEVLFFESARVVRAELIAVFFLFERRNEWIDWHGNTNKVQRFYTPFFSSTEATAAAEQARLRGSQFSIADSVAAALHVQGGGMGLIFDYYDDSPLQGLAPNLKDLGRKLSLTEINDVLPYGKFLRMTGYFAKEMPAALDRFQPGTTFYNRYATSGGKRNGLAWSMKPRPLVPKFGLQIVAEINSVLSRKIGTRAKAPSVATSAGGTAALVNAKAEPSPTPKSKQVLDPTPPVPPACPVEETEREQLSKARIGQGRYRAYLEQVESRCRVTRLADRDYLIASHIKPWHDCNDDEKLDGNNGLLLSPHVDKLFDKGLISFGDDGQLLISPKLERLVLTHWSIATNLNVGTFNAGQRSYLKYHRERVFQR